MCKAHSTVSDPERPLVNKGVTDVVLLLMDTGLNGEAVNDIRLLGD